jgi:hypothetical protein
MIDYLHEAGWPIYPVLLFGFTSLLFAIRYARAPQSEVLALVASLGLASLAMGAFGTVVGLQHAIEYIRELPAERRWIVIVGLREALCNMAPALAFVVIDLVCVTSGLLRRVPPSTR